MFICVHCQSELKLTNPDNYSCSNCSAAYRRGPAGYFEMMREAAPGSGTTSDYVACQHHCCHGVFEYLQPLLQQEPCRTVLDVGCGVGALTTSLIDSGFDAFGVDLPEQAQHWAAAKNNPDRFVSASALQLPFPSESFDFVYSLGVIEHIGTSLGHCTLAPDYQSQRQQYAKEILRVAKPGGRILIACPNKTFPIDVQHGPGDALEKAGAIRSAIFERTGMNIHKTWGRYHLLSYGEVKSLFRVNGEREFKALPLQNYFGFGRFKKGFLKPFAGLAEYWVHNLTPGLRTTFLNPYVMAQIRK